MKGIGHVRTLKRGGQLVTGYCQVCGKGVPLGKRTLCADPRCHAERRRRYQYEYYWQVVLGHTDPPPSRAEAPVTCKVCGKRLDNDHGARVAYCSEFCRRVRRAEYWRTWYHRNHERHVELKERFER